MSAGFVFAGLAISDKRCLREQLGQMILFPKKSLYVARILDNAFCVNPNTLKNEARCGNILSCRRCRRCPRHNIGAIPTRLGRNFGRYPIAGHGILSPCLGGAAAASFACSHWSIDGMSSGISRRASINISPRLFSVLLTCTIALFPLVGAAATLQSVYNAAGPQGVYTKYLDLDKGVTYTGGLLIAATDNVCIRGNGATLDLETATILVQGADANLDIDHCVIKNGGLAGAGYTQGALNFVGSHGSVVNNVIVGCTIGVRVYASGPGLVTVMNNIIVHNTITGLLCQIGNEPLVSYNDSWSDGTYNYLRDCG